jgi:hypothetical protein
VNESGAKYGSWLSPEKWDGFQNNVTTIQETSTDDILAVISEGAKCREILDVFVGLSRAVNVMRVT